MLKKLIKKSLIMMLNFKCDDHFHSTLSRLDPNKQYLFTCNHVSMKDGPMVALLMDRPLVCPVAIEYTQGYYAYIMKWLEWLTGGKVIALDRNNPTAGTRCLYRFAKDSSMSVLIFPQGGINSCHDKMGANWLSDKLNIEKIDLNIDHSMVLSIDYDIKN